MKGTRDFLINILSDLSDAAAIVNQNGVVLHSNKAFNMRFSSTKGAKNQGVPLRLQNLDLKSNRETSQLQGLFLPGKDTSCVMNVYLTLQRRLIDF